MGSANANSLLQGSRYCFSRGSEGYPESLLDLSDPPKKLFVIGNPEALQGGISIIGARKATPYGLSCASKFACIAAQHGVTVISGGALGCDSAAHRGALEGGGKTVVVLGGGCDRIYPARNKDLFQSVIDSGGAVISEQDWTFPAKPFLFRARNRIIAALSKATLIAEAGLPSGTFSTADEALSINRDVLVIPGAITSETSLGSNQLLYQGATPIINEETFEDLLVLLFNCLRIEDVTTKECAEKDDPLLQALMANPMRMDEILKMKLDCDESFDPLTWVTLKLSELESKGFITRYTDGRYGPASITV